MAYINKKQFIERLSFGAAVSGGIAPLVLAATGYSAQAAMQTPLSLAGIKTLYIGAATIGMILAGIFMILFLAETQRRRGKLFVIK